MVALVGDDFKKKLVKKKEDAFLPGDDIRLLGNQRVRLAILRSGLNRLPRQTQLRLTVVQRLVSKKKLSLELR